jgi:rod shape determining protein RodA
MAQYRKPVLGRIDLLTVLLVCLLVSVGIMAVYTSEYTSFDEPFFDMSRSHMKQLTFFGISCFIALVIIFTDSKLFYSMANLSYLFGIFLLLITFVIGGEVKGSHSFIKLGTFTFQPGEACKIFTALCLARFLATPETKFNTLRDRLIASAIVLLPCLLIILQNETGLALVYFAFFLPMYREGLQ